MGFKRLFLAFVFPFFVLCQSYAVTRDCRKILLSDLPQVSRVVEKNSFQYGRGLSEYRHDLHKDFKSSLIKLKPTEIWIDVGGGRGNAIEDYLKSHDNLSSAAQTVLITYNLGRFFGIPKYKGKLKLLSGRLLEEIPVSEIPKAKLMTDYFGVISYTRDLTKALHIIFDRLLMSGELYIFSNNMFATIVTHEGPVSLTRFFQMIPGIKVEGEYGILKITKTSEEVVVPELELIRLDETTSPPHRRFRIKGVTAE